MSMQRNHSTISPTQMSAHPFDLIRMHIWRRVFDGGREIENDLILDGGLPDVGDRLTDLQSEIEFRAGKALRRILKTHLGPGGRQRPGGFLDPLCSAGSNLNNLCATCLEDVFSLSRRRGIV